MADAADFPFRGWITRLTPEQGGHETGPPIPPARQRHGNGQPGISGEGSHTGLPS
jgi:hypothetical protein